MRPRPTPPLHEERGFTLLELLIAVSLLGLIFAALAGGLRFGTAAWQSAAVRLGDSDDLQLVYRVLRRQISAAVPSGEGVTAAEGATRFVGAATGLRFAGRAPSQGMPSGLYRLGLVLRPDGPARALVLEWEGLGGEGSGTEPLVRGVAGMQVAYLRDPGAGSGTRWVSEWSEEGVLPRAVRLELHFVDRARRPWPPLVFAIPAAGD